jgi:hypothetical protein
MKEVHGRQTMAMEEANKSAVETTKTLEGGAVVTCLFVSA